GAADLPQQDRAAGAPGEARGPLEQAREDDQVAAAPLLAAVALVELEPLDEDGAVRGGQRVELRLAELRERQPFGRLDAARPQLPAVEMEALVAGHARGRFADLRPR